MNALLVAALVAFGLPKELPADIAALVPAQRPPVSAVLQRLGSPNPADRAWGAFLASAYRMNEAAPSLLALLNAAADDTRYDGIELANIIDALLQLDATPSPVVLQRLAEYRHDPGLLLLMLLNPVENGDALLRIVRSTEWSHGAWFAAARAEVELHSPAAIAELYELIAVRGTLTVVSRGGGFGMGGFGAESRDGVATRWPKDYPPQPRYDLSLDCRTDKECNTAIEREWSGPKLTSAAPLAPAVGGQRTTYATPLLARLFDEPLQDQFVALLAASQKYTIALDRPQQLPAKVAEVERPLRLAHRQLSDGLVKQGLLKPDHVKPLLVRWVVSDGRPNRHQALPKLPNEISAE